MTDFKSNKSKFLELMPEFLNEMCADPESAQLIMVHDGPTLQPTVAFSMSWYDALGSEEKVQRAVAKFLKRMETADEAEEEVAPFSLKLSQSHTNYLAGGPPKPVELMCDGPCKREFSSDRLNSIGRCGHYLCNACFGIVKNSDGTNGCSSKSCFWRGSRENTDKCYETEICQKQRERARALKSQGVDVKSADSVSNSSISDSSSETEVHIPQNIKMKLAVLYNDETYGVVHNNYELTAPGNSLIGDVFLAILKKGSPAENKKHGRLYLVGAGGLDTAKRLHKNQVYKMKLKDLAKSENSLNFLLDMDKCLKKSGKSTSPAGRI